MMMPRRYAHWRLPPVQYYVMKRPITMYARERFREMLPISPADEEVTGSRATATPEKESVLVN